MLKVILSREPNARIQRGGRGPDPPPPGKSQSYSIPYQYWSGSHGKSQNYQDSIQFWAIIGPPGNAISSARQRNNISSARQQNAI